MKTTIEYLKECKDMACHNLLCYSKTYSMDTPKEGMEQAFVEAKRDVEIVEELLTMVETFQTKNLEHYSVEDLKEAMTAVQQRQQITSQYNKVDTVSLHCKASKKHRGVRKVEEKTVLQTTFEDFKPTLEKICCSLSSSNYYSLNCRVDRNGVTIPVDNMKLTYFSNDLLMYQGSRVMIQLNPENICNATVSTIEDNKIFRVNLNKIH